MTTLYKTTDYRGHSITVITEELTHFASTVYRTEDGCEHDTLAQAQAYLDLMLSCRHALNQALLGRHDEEISLI